jgi:hypothetical protein
MKAYRESRNETPVILQLGTLWRSVVGHNPSRLTIILPFLATILVFYVVFLFPSILLSLPLIIFHPLFTSLHLIVHFSFLSLIFSPFFFLKSHFVPLLPSIVISTLISPVPLSFQVHN